MTNKWWFWVCILFIITGLMAGLNAMTQNLIDALDNIGDNEQIQELKIEIEQLRQENATLKTPSYTTFPSIEEDISPLKEEKNIDKEEKPASIENEYEEYTVDEMIKEYKDNSVRAEKTFIDKKVKISGEISYFGERSGTPYFSIPSHNSWWYDVNCFPSKNIDEDFFLSFNEGDKVIVYGKIIKCSRGYEVEVYDIKNK